MRLFQLGVATVLSGNNGWMTELHVKNVIQCPPSRRFQILTPSRSSSNAEWSTRCGWFLMNVEGEKSASAFDREIFDIILLRYSSSVLVDRRSYIQAWREKVLFSTMLFCTLKSRRKSYSHSYNFSIDCSFLRISICFAKRIKPIWYIEKGQGV